MDFKNEIIQIQFLIADKLLGINERKKNTSDFHFDCHISNLVLKYTVA